MNRLLAGGVVAAVVACGSDRGTQRAASTPAPTPAASSSAPDAGPPAPVPDGPALLGQARAAIAVGDHVGGRELARRAQEHPAVAVDAGLLRAESHLQDDGNLVAAEEALVASGAAAVDAGITLMARIRQAQGRPGEARTLLEPLATRAPTEAWIPERLAQLDMAEAAAAHAAHDEKKAHQLYRRAATELQKARSLGADTPAVALAEGRALEGAGDLAGAEKALARLLTLLPDQPTGHVQLAEFFARHGQKSRAAEHRKAAGVTESAPAHRKLRPLQPSAR